MVSDRRSAFTVVELLVGLLIGASLIALLLPALGAVKKRALERRTQSDLRQMWLAVALYRQDYETLEAGPSSALGLPNVDGFYRMLKAARIDWWGVEGRWGYGPVYYPYDPSDFLSGLERFGEIKLERWTRHSLARKDRSVLIGDFQHTEGCGRFPEPHCVFVGLGVLLEGTLVRRRAPGEITDPEWWVEEESR